MVDLDDERAWIEKQKDLEALVEEKSDVIRELHLKLQEHPPAVPARECTIAPREEELLALSEELEQERRSDW